MSAAQVLTGSPANLVATSANQAAANIPLTTRQAAGNVAGVVVSSLTAGSDTSLYVNATLPAAAAGVGAAGDVFSYRHSVAGNATGAGGVLSGRYQIFTYKNGAFEAELLRSGVPQGADEGVIYATVLPLTGPAPGVAGSRVGTFTTSGAANQQVSVPSIRAGSYVKLALVGTTNAGGLAAYNAVVNPTATTVIGPPPAFTGFTIQGPAGAMPAGLIYAYEVIG